ncbi:hypothetical protein F0562_007829 [Nyssa sinensis]|uniref:Peptidase S8/S53 domain-containing protein n=1 Tax=Nyssa sinensis TaxID=561372 RepID=A0A5J5A9U5_9ASTE|nr:hypothetical protein F0562_007829 [Nyssa sinensis]
MTGFLTMKDSNKTHLFALIHLLLILSGQDLIAPVDANSGVHIVYVEKKHHNDPKLVTDSHHDLLVSVVGRYPQLADLMYSIFFLGLPGVVRVIPNRFHTLQITRSWDYLSLSSHSPTNLLRDSNMGDGVIIGVIDSAIHDGVDVLSLAIGSIIPLFSDVDERDGIATGSFHVVASGITVVCAASNVIPFAQTVQNTAPWIMTIAASTMDRSFPTKITLGNNKTIWVLYFTVFSKAYETEH